MAQRIGTRSSRWLGLQRALALRVRECWQRLRAGLRRWRTERHTRAELHGLDARMLRDLGLDPGQIPWIARPVAGHGGPMHVAALRGIGAED